MKWSKDDDTEVDLKSDIFKKIGCALGYKRAISFDQHKVGRHVQNVLFNWETMGLYLKQAGKRF